MFGRRESVTEFRKSLEARKSIGQIGDPADNPRSNQAGEPHIVITKPSSEWGGGAVRQQQIQE